MDNVRDIDERLINFLNVVADAPCEVRKVTDKFVNSIDNLKKNYIKNIVRTRNVKEKYSATEEYVDSCECECKQWKRKDSYLDQISVEKRRNACNALVEAKLELAMRFCELQIAEREMDLTKEQLGRLSKRAEYDFLWSLRQHPDRQWIQLYDDSGDEIIESKMKRLSICSIDLPTPPSGSFVDISGTDATVKRSLVKQKKVYTEETTLKWAKNTNNGFQTSESSEETYSITTDEPSTRKCSPLPVKPQVAILRLNESTHCAENVDEGIGDLDWNPSQKSTSGVDIFGKGGTTRHYDDDRGNLDYSRSEMSLNEEKVRRRRHDDDWLDLRRQPSFDETDVSLTSRKYRMDDSREHSERAFPPEESEYSQTISLSTHSNHYLYRSGSAYSDSLTGRDPRQKISAQNSDHMYRDEPEIQIRPLSVEDFDSLHKSDSDIPAKDQREKRYHQSSPRYPHNIGDLNIPLYPEVRASERTHQSVERSDHFKESRYSRSAESAHGGGEEYRQRSRTTGNISESDYSKRVEDIGIKKEQKGSSVRLKDVEYSLSADRRPLTDHCDRFRKSIDVNERSHHVTTRSTKSHRNSSEESLSKSVAEKNYEHSRRRMKIDESMYSVSADGASMFSSVYEDRGEGRDFDEQSYISNKRSTQRSIPCNEGSRRKHDLDDRHYSKSADMQKFHTLDEQFRRPHFTRSADKLGVDDQLERRENSSQHIRTQQRHVRQAKRTRNRYEEEERGPHRRQGRSMTPSVVLTTEMNVSTTSLAPEDETNDSVEWDNDVLRQRTSSSEHPPSFDRDSDIISSTMSEYTSSMDSGDLTVHEGKDEDDGQVGIDKEKKGKHKKKKIWQLISNVLHGPWEGWESD